MTDMIVAADTSSDVATYVNASLGSALNYASSVASAFGTFQIGTRQARYNATVASNPRKAFYGQEVTRATNMKSLRDQYYSVAGEAISDYYASITSAYTDYVSGALTALTTAERAYFSALKSYSIASINADGDYALALFNAERDRAEAYIDAAITEMTANYAKEAELAANRASAYATQLSAIIASFNATQFAEGRGGHGAVVDTMTQSEQTEYFGEIEERPEFVGTFNYWSLNLEGDKFDYWVSVPLHFVFDVLPYWRWGNSLRDSTFFWERIYVMSKKGSGPVEVRLYPKPN